MVGLEKHGGHRLGDGAKGSAAQRPKAAHTNAEPSHSSSLPQTLCSTLTAADANGGGMGGMMQDLAFAIPGVDEAMGFAEIMK